MQLSKDACKRAVAYVNLNARPLDRAMLDFYFFDGSTEAVIEQLTRYQNHDGGFGHALEPDFRALASTPLATTVAFQSLIAINAQATHEVVRHAINYLLNTYDADARSWSSLVPEVDDYPRAQWWNYSPPVSYAPEAKFWGNPNCEIVAYLAEYAELVTPNFIRTRIDEALEWINNVPELEGHELICCLRLAHALSSKNSIPIFERVGAAAKRIVACNPEQWANYGPQPIWYVRHPFSSLSRLFGDALDANLDYVIEAQQPDGSWQPNWHWGRYEDAWPTAKREWAGHITVGNLKLLADFGRLEANCFPAQDGP